MWKIDSDKIQTNKMVAKEGFQVKGVVVVIDPKCYTFSEMG